MGYHTQMGPNCLVDKGIGISNDPALCGKELNESYCGTEMTSLFPAVAGS